MRRDLPGRLPLGKKAAGGHGVSALPAAEDKKAAYPRVEKVAASILQDSLLTDGTRAGRSGI